MHEHGGGVTPTVKQRLSGGFAPTQVCTYCSQTLWLCSCTNHRAAWLCHTLTMLSVGRLHNSNNNAAIDADLQSCVQQVRVQVQLKIARALFILWPGGCCFLPDVARWSRLARKGAARWVGARPYIRPASGCIADLSSCTRCIVFAPKA